MNREKLSEIVTTDLGEARAVVGVTQDELASRLEGLSRSYIAMIETGARDYPEEHHEAILEALLECHRDRVERRKSIREIVEKLNPWSESDAERLALRRRLAELELQNR